MNEEAKKMYREYLKDKLDLIFNNNGTKGITNPFKENYLSNSNMTILFKKKIVDGKIYLLDYNNDKFADESFDEIGDAGRYFVEVKRDSKWNIFNLKTKVLVSKEWYDGIGSLSDYLKDNFALVKNKGKQNLLDLNTGKTIDNGWHDYIVGEFKNGYVEVLDKINGKYYSNLMNKNGNLYFEDNRDCATLELLSNGLVLVGYGEIKVGQRDGHKMLIIPTNEETNRFLVTKDGKELKDLSIDDVKEYTNDIILVNNNRFINKKIEILNNREYENVEIVKHSNGHVYAIAKRNFYNIINENGQEIPIEICSKIKNLDYDSFYVRSIFSGHEIINIVNDKVNKILVNNLIECNNMVVAIKVIYKYRLYSLAKHDYFNDEKYDECIVQNNSDYLIVYKRINGFRKGNVLDLNSGKLLLDKWQKDIVSFDNKKDFYRYEMVNKLVLKSKLRGVEIKKVLQGYVLKKDNEKIVLPYLPIKFYGERFILCTDGYNYYLFDKFSNQVIRKYEAGYLKYDDNFLLSGHHDEEDKLEFIYENKILDITDYYFGKLVDLDTIKVNSNVEILEEDTFKYMNLQDIERRLQEEKEKNKKVLELQVIKSKEEKIDSIKNQEATRQREHQELKKRYLKELLTIVNKIRDLDSFNINERMEIDNLLVDKINYLEINPFYDSILAYLDLSMMGFKNVKVSGIDFSNTNIYLVNTLFNGNYLNIGLDPQTVYGKDLSNCNFNGIHISPWVNFSDVNIKGASFSSDYDIKTLDIINPTMKNAVYDDTTTFNGRPISEYFEETKKLIK